MYSVPISQYPKDKEWNQKANSTPAIPGGKNMLLINLRKLLLLVKDNAPKDQVPVLEGSNSKSTLDQLCAHQLSAMNFVKRSSDGTWVLSNESQIWLDSEDDRYLATYFCTQVKFFSEILYYLDSPKTSRELFDIAVNEYDLEWKITTTVNNRLVWLRQFGFIEFQEFSLLYSITDSGKDFLDTISVPMPESISKDEDDTQHEEEISIESTFLDYYSGNNKVVRKTGFGYLPGNTNGFVSTVAEILSLIDSDNTIEAINNFAQNKYGIKDSSTRSALNTLSSLGIIVRKTNSAYAVTDLGHLWLKDKDILSLIPLFQIRCLFFVEILFELNNKTLSRKELAAKAKISYGFDKENIPEISNRISMLKQAKLLRNISAEKYTLTKRGLLFINKYGELFGLSNPLKQTVPAIDNTDIISELRMASKDSFNPGKFEKTVRDFFEMIGFDSKWLGGSGKTDVLLKATDSPENPFIVTVDTKATSSSTVSDGLVDFDTLEDHRKKHGSDYIAIVGRDFNERLINRAKEHRVVLFDIDTLEKLFVIHQQTPLKISAYKKVFEQSGKADLTVLDNDIIQTKDTGSLITGIMRHLIDECKDPITKGYLSVRDLYMSLRADEEFLKVPSIEEIENTLEFLSSPIIGCVKKDKDYYHATGTLRDMANILEYLQRRCF